MFALGSLVKGNTDIQSEVELQVSVTTAKCRKQALVSALRQEVSLYCAMLSRHCFYSCGPSSCTVALASVLCITDLLCVPASRHTLSTPFSALKVVTRVICYMINAGRHSDACGLPWG